MPGGDSHERLPALRSRMLQQLLNQYAEQNCTTRWPSLVRLALKHAGDKLALKALVVF